MIIHWCYQNGGIRNMNSFNYDDAFRKNHRTYDHSINIYIENNLSWVTEGSDESQEAELNSDQIKLLRSFLCSARDYCKANEIPPGTFEAIDVFCFLWLTFHEIANRMSLYLPKIDVFESAWIEPFTISCPFGLHVDHGQSQLSSDFQKNCSFAHADIQTIIII